MAVTPQKKSIWNKHFPTMLGLGVLVIALVAGIFLVGSSTNVFSPRATPQTTPKNIQLTNVSDSGFTVSFLTDEPAAGFVKYGTSPNDLSQQASDDRDQLTGTVGTFTTHHVTLRGLQPNTQYYYELGTGTRDTFDNNGAPFAVQTYARTGSPSAAQTAYGTILDRNSSPASGALVFVTAPGIEPMSTLVKDSGSWAVPLSNARSSDGSYADISSVTALQLRVQGTLASDSLTYQVGLDATQPVTTLTFGQTPAAVASTGNSTPDLTTNDEIMASDSAALQGSGVAVPDQSLPDITAGGLTDVLDTADGVIDLLELEQASASGTIKTPEVSTTTPIIKGVAAPSTKVTITVHSDTQIEQEVISDENGNFVLDLAELQQGLEPGEHTVTYSYIDPNTGQEVTGTHTFYVTGSTGLLAQADTGGPFGSGNPYPVGGTPTPTPTPTASSSATPTPTATLSATPAPSSTSSGVVYPATGSGIPVSGSFGTTVALVIGGLFFLLTGTWSYYLAQKAAVEEEE